MAIIVQFYDAEDDKRSQTYGPYSFVRVVHRTLMVTFPHTNNRCSIAQLLEPQGPGRPLWWVLEENQGYSDIMMS